MSTNPSPSPSLSAQNRAARLLAVQAVYQREITPTDDAASLTAEYMAHRAGMEVDGETLVEPNPDLLKSLIFGVIEKDEDLKDIILKNRGAGEGDAKLPEPLMMACLLCGCYELVFTQDVDFPIIISDYVDIAKAFYEGREPGLVNAVLDSVRKVARD